MAVAGLTGLPKNTKDGKAASFNPCPIGCVAWFRGIRQNIDERCRCEKEKCSRIEILAQSFLNQAMFSVTILGSGSAGNCAVVASERTRLLIDGGLSAKQMVARLSAAGVEPETIAGILITHEHSDHIGGLDVFCRKYGTPIYCNRLTAEAMGQDAKKNWRFFSTGGDFVVNDIAVETFSIPHDAVDPVGFVLHYGDVAFGFCTDLGFATKLVIERIRSAQTLVIETNHDEEMLRNDPRRPWPVKQRILSRHGHLSNASASEVLAELLNYKLRRAILGHLSRDCNTPSLALETVQARLRKEGAEAVEICCASQLEVSETFPIGF